MFTVKLLSQSKTKHAAILIMAALALLCMCASSFAGDKCEFENFGMMVPEAGNGMVLHGPGKSGEVDTIYMIFNNINNIDSF